MSERAWMLEGGGEMGARMREKDWSQTPLGRVEGWPAGLRTAVGLVLSSRAAVGLFWGPEGVLLYNDAFRPLIGDKHPSALGEPIRRVFAEVWDFLGTMLDEVARTGTALYLENQPFFMNRQGFLDESYFTFSYTPIRDEHGRVVGFFDFVNETTRQVLGERRIHCLRELSLRTAPAQTPRAVLEAAGEVLGQSERDVPFALLYRLEARTARLVLRTGLPPDARVAPERLALDDARPWPPRRGAALGRGAAPRGRERGGGRPRGTLAGAGEPGAARAAGAGGQRHAGRGAHPGTQSPAPRGRGVS